MEPEKEMEPESKMEPKAKDGPGTKTGPEEEGLAGGAGGRRIRMEKDGREELEAALEELHGFVLGLAQRAGEDREYGERLWREIRNSEGLLKELAYYHDYGEFWNRYRIGGYTLADALVWQVDHFKLYMDRPRDMNRYRRERLLLSAFETMLRLEKDPAGQASKMQGETGQDIQPGM